MNDLGAGLLGVITTGFIKQNQFTEPKNLLLDHDDCARWADSCIVAGHLYCVQQRRGGLRASNGQLCFQGLWVKLLWSTEAHLVQVCIFSRFQEDFRSCKYHGAKMCQFKLSDAILTSFAPSQNLRSLPKQSSTWNSRKGVIVPAILPPSARATIINRLNISWQVMGQKFCK